MTVTMVAVSVQTLLATRYRAFVQKLKMDRDRGLRVVAEIPIGSRTLHARVGGRPIDLEDFDENNASANPSRFIPLPDSRGRSLAVTFQKP